MDALGTFPSRVLPLVPILATILLLATVTLTSTLFALYYDFSVGSACEVLGGHCDSDPGDLPSISFTFIPGLCYPISAVGIGVAAVMFMLILRPVHAAIEEEGDEMLGNDTQVPMCFCCASAVPVLPHACHVTPGFEYESMDKAMDEEIPTIEKYTLEGVTGCGAPSWPKLRLRGTMRLLLALAGTATLLLLVVGVVNLKVNAAVHGTAATLMFVMGILWLVLLTALQSEILSGDRGDFRFRLHLKQAGCAIMLIAIVVDVGIQIAVSSTPAFAGPSSWSAGAVNEYLVALALCCGFVSLSGDLMAKRQRSLELDQARSELAEGLLG
mmetsp:Transcript_4908/g.19626  ORF Transcript_4908/g.19626 Transcript_4908/m.19626 type:complete len:327 (-) Transcript_4908:43-1023(-)